MSTPRNAPAISIGMMAHNSAEYIGEAIESVLAQNRSDWELIVSDDASTDGTGDVVRPYLADSRIRYHLHNDNLGQARNWRFVIRQARGPVFARLDADDCWLPDTCAGFLDSIKDDADVVYGSWCRVGRLSPGMPPGVRHSNRTLSGVEAYERQARHNTILQGSVAARTEVLHRAGEPYPDLRYMVDYEYFLRVLAVSRKVISISATVLRYRTHERNETSSAQSSLGYVAERPVLFAHCQDHVGLNEDVKPLLDVLHYHLCADDFSDGLSEAVRRDRDAGIRIMRDAVRRCPSLLQQPKVVMDLLLACLGTPGHRIMRRLHRRRVEA